MKKLSFLSFAATLILSTVVHADVPLVQNGVAQATIYFSKTPTPGHIEARPISLSTRFHAPINPATHKVENVSPQVTAVRELNYHLEKMTGARLRTVQTDNPADVKGNAIVLGSLAGKMGAQIKTASPSKEGFRLLARNNTILIAGETDDGTLFGAYRLLRHLGCDWVMPGTIGEVIPRRQSVAVPDMDESSQPGFPVRFMWWSSRFTSPEEMLLNSQWLRRNGKGDYYPPVMFTGGHYWDKFIKKHKPHFDADPTMYALVREPGGKLVRKGPQIETTHPKVIELMVQDIRDEFAAKNWPRDKEVGFPYLGPADTSESSLSAESQNAGSGAVDPLSGDPEITDIMVLLGNIILERIKGEYPNVWLGYYAYHNYQEFPKRYQPNPRLAVIFAPLRYGQYHSALDPHSKTMSYYRQVVEKWGAQAKAHGNPLIFRGYNFNNIEMFSPYTKLGIWKDEIPFYHRMGFLGMNVESVNQWGNYGAHDYMLMQLAWNPQLNWDQTFAAYCRNAFGNAAPQMRQYFERLMKRQSEAGQEAGSFDALHLIYTPEIVAACKRDLEAALQAAQEPEQKTRVQYVADSFTSLEIYLDYHRATLAFDFAAAKEHYDQLIIHLNDLIKENSLLGSGYAQHQLNRFLKDYSAIAAQYSTDNYRIVHRLPEELPTSLDPYGAGKEMELFSPALDESRWLRTKTASTTWQDQGLELPKSGAVWYRHRFTLTPQQVQGKVGLLLGSYADTARVWLNGKPIEPLAPAPVYGGLMKPQVFDLTPALKTDAPNLLAIEITRTSRASFYGVGGITKPSFLFTGPTLR